MEDETDDLEATLKMVGVDFCDLHIDRIADSIVATGVHIEYVRIISPPFFDDLIKEGVEVFSPDLIMINLDVWNDLWEDREFLKKRHFRSDIKMGFRIIRRYHDSFTETPIVVYSKYISEDSQDRKSKKYERKAIRSGAVAALPSSYCLANPQSFLQYVDV